MPKEKRFPIGVLVASCDEAAMLAASIEQYKNDKFLSFLVKEALISGTRAAILDCRETTYYDW
jgi:hypothetical protein